MKGHCRFLQVKDGICYFAEVWVEICPGSGAIEVVDAIPDQVDADAGEVNRHTAPTWVAAALDGIATAVEYARRIGSLPTACQVRLEKLVGSFVDTRDDVVRCAAGLAVWDARGAPGPSPEPRFDGHSWHVKFPAPVHSPVEGLSR